MENPFFIRPTVLASLILLINLNYPSDALSAGDFQSCSVQVGFTQQFRASSDDLSTPWDRDTLLWWEKEAAWKKIPNIEIQADQSYVFYSELAGRPAKDYRNTVGLGQAMAYVWIQYSPSECNSDLAPSSKQAKFVGQINLGRGFVRKHFALLGPGGRWNETFSVLELKFYRKSL